MAVEVRNPHSVLAALKIRPRDVVEVRLHGYDASGAWDEVVEAARRQGVPVRQGVVRQEKMRRSPKIESTKSGRTGSAEATIKENGGVDLPQLFAQKTGDAETHGLWLALDQLQDPHNVGAVFRSAAFFGVRGIVLTRDRSAPLNGTVYDVASGGLEYVRFSSQPNLSRALELAKKAGLWVLGTSEHAEMDVSEITHDRSWLLVLGNEEKGLRRLTQEHCDLVCRLSPRGEVKSLNVSVAAGVLMSTLTSQG